MQGCSMSQLTLFLTNHIFETALSNLCQTMGLSSAPPKDTAAPTSKDSILNGDLLIAALTQEGGQCGFSAVPGQQGDTGREKLQRSETKNDQYQVKVPVKGQMEEIRPVKFREEIMWRGCMELHKMMLAIMRRQRRAPVCPSLCSKDRGGSERLEGCLEWC